MNVNYSEKLSFPFFDTNPLKTQILTQVFNWFVLPLIKSITSGQADEN